MAVTIEAFVPDHLGAIARFSEKYWARPRTEAFLRWRYVESQKFARMFLALQDGECVATVSALKKSYLVEDVPTECLEVFDWHCLEGWRGTGVGLRVMRAMMRQREPILSISGMPDVVSTLPRMGWRKIATALTFELPTSGALVAAALQRRSGIPAWITSKPLGALVAWWYIPKRRRGPSPGELVPVSEVGDEVLGLYSGEPGYEVVQVPQPEMLRWMTACQPGNGSYLYFCFTLDGRLRGWIMARVFERRGMREASLLEVYAPRPDVRTYRWMVREASSVLAGFQPWLIRARASCPVLQAALRASRFRQNPDETPVYLWGKEDLPGARPVHVTLNHADEPLRPYAVP